MRVLPQSLLVRPRLLIALGAIAVLALVLPNDWRWSTRTLIAWDAGAILYLALASTMLRESLDEIKARAASQDEGAWGILIIACLATAASVAAIAVQLASLGNVPAGLRGQHIALGALTILCSWILLQVFFALHYAHAFYSDSAEGKGFDFPGGAEPSYLDFLYLSFTIGCASQTSDVAVTTREARAVVLLHSILAFFFNTSILAFGINIGASLVSGGN